MLSMGVLAAGRASAGGRVPDEVRGPAQAKLQREKFGDLRIYFDGPTEQLKALQAGSLKLKPGMSPHPPHQHPEEEIMLITEGGGEILVDGKTTRVGPGSMMHCAAGHTHGVTNTGKTPMTFFFYKWIGG
jgi:quercetin dioxygenase-like cupin family protein